MLIRHSSQAHIASQKRFENRLPTDQDVSHTQTLSRILGCLNDLTCTACANAHLPRRVEPRRARIAKTKTKMYAEKWNDCWEYTTYKKYILKHILNSEKEEETKTKQVYYANATQPTHCSFLITLRKQKLFIYISVLFFITIFPLIFFSARSLRSGRVASSSDGAQRRLQTGQPDSHSFIHSFTCDCICIQ